jgi:fatty acid desaturase
MIFKKSKKPSKLKKWFTRNKFKIEFATTVNLIFAFQIFFIILFAGFLMDFLSGLPGMYLIFSILSLIISFKMYQLRMFYKESFLKSIKNSTETVDYKNLLRGIRRNIDSKMKKQLKTLS